MKKTLFVLAILGGLSSSVFALGLKWEVNGGATSYSAPAKNGVLSLGTSIKVDLTESFDIGFKYAMSPGTSIAGDLGNNIFFDTNMSGVTFMFGIDYKLKINEQLRHNIGLYFGNQTGQIESVDYRYPSGTTTVTMGSTPRGGSCTELSYALVYDFMENYYLSGTLGYRKMDNVVLDTSKINGTTVVASVDMSGLIYGLSLGYRF